MYKDKKILCVITARGGSKRLPGKNIKPLNGKPLIGYVIEAAKGSKYLDRIIVSTDDEAIAAVAKEFGAEVPFMRPPELASDTATSADALQHAVRFVEGEGEHYDLVVLMQPTVPGVLPQDVEASIEKLVESEANSCITVCDVREHPNASMYMAESGALTPYVQKMDTHARSQDLQKLYHVNGAVYVSTRQLVVERGLIIDPQSCVGVLMPRERSADIDTALDFAIAQHLLKSSHPA